MPHTRAPAIAGHRSSTRLAVACAVVVLAATAVRTWVAAAGWFYWDDLILHGQAAAHRLPDPSLLFADHDGHLMPGGMALVWVAAHLAPLDFRVPLAQIALLHLIAGGAVARMLWVLLRGRPVLLAPLAAALALPLSLPASTWWSSALNSLPLIAAMAWAAASTVLLARTGRRRYAVGAVAATVVGVLFVEKALLVPVVAAAVLLGWWWTGAAGGVGLRALWRSTRAAWAGQAVVVAAWTALFVVVVGRAGGGDVPSDSEGGRPGLVDLVDHSYRLAVGPTLAGGPWRWERWHPGPPMADPTVAAVLAGVLAGAGVLAWSLTTRRRTGPVWAVAALYPLVPALLVAAGRAGPDTAAEIVHTLRYHPELVVVLAAALALALGAPRRPGNPGRGRTAAVAGTTALVVVLVSSAFSTVAYRQIWVEQPSRDYLVPLLDALHERREPLLDLEVPLEVLLPVTTPAHRLSSVLAGVPDIPDVGAWTTDPVVVDPGGSLHPAGVVPGRTIQPGPDRDCGYRIAAGGTRIPLDGPLLGRDWVVQLNYLTDSAGQVGVRLDEGKEVTAPVVAGLGTVFVRVEGSGTELTVTPRDVATQDVDLCIGSGPVGVLVPR